MRVEYKGGTKQRLTKIFGILTVLWIFMASGGWIWIETGDRSVWSLILAIVGVVGTAGFGWGCFYCFMTDAETRKVLRLPEVAVPAKILEKEWKIHIDEYGRHLEIVNIEVLFENDQSDIVREKFSIIEKSKPYAPKYKEAMEKIKDGDVGELTFKKGKIMRHLVAFDGNCANGRIDMNTAVRLLNANADDYRVQFFLKG